MGCLRGIVWADFDIVGWVIGGFLVVWGLRIIEVLW